MKYQYGKLPTDEELLAIPTLEDEQEDYEYDDTQADLDYGWNK